MARGGLSHLFLAGSRESLAARGESRKGLCFRLWEHWLADANVLAASRQDASRLHWQCRSLACALLSKLVDFEPHFVRVV